MIGLLHMHSSKPIDLLLSFVDLLFIARLYFEHYVTLVYRVSSLRQLGFVLLDYCQLLVVALLDPFLILLLNLQVAFLQYLEFFLMILVVLLHLQQKFLLFCLTLICYFLQIIELSLQLS